MTDRLLTAAELAESLALSTSTVLDWFEAAGFQVSSSVASSASESPKCSTGSRRSGSGRRTRLDDNRRPWHDRSVADCTSLHLPSIPTSMRVASGRAGSRVARGPSR